MEPTVKLSAEQVECLASPVRMAVFETFRALGEGSVLEVARQLGAPPTSLYYHLDQLLGAGLLVQSGSRSAKTKVELLFKPSSSRLVIDKLDRSSTHRSALKRSLSAALRDAEKDFDHAQDASDLEDPTQLLRITPRLSEEDAEELRRRLADLGEWIRSREASAGQRYSLTAVFSPKRN